MNSRRSPLEDRSKLRYGVSVTDPCLDWASTEALLRRASRELADALGTRAASGRA